MNKDAVKRDKAKKLLTKIRGEFESAGASTRCNKVEGWLKKLGFTVESGKTKGHKLYKHTEIENFFGSNYNCGHGKNPEVKRPYINNILSVLDEYEDQIADYLIRTM